ncbi:ATP-dependent zinc metalloprotease FtsH [Mycoplasma sp. Ms02]|uniref:ATP-dependent zinc metalloprotease FtsH n=1 Tax=Mycoplasma sp. Ms02 TaxID=353851 RepID=UPI001C89BC55|nr:ATP-dependent zinc metalloprotease FtsH [Mycoplasma sp. Ms02]QZE12064.1 ATP-dependent zinc metalloprotease FtsH [Mycoplasma sp. Ms02]
MKNKRHEKPNGRKLAIALVVASICIALLIFYIVTAYSKSGSSTNLFDLKNDLESSLASTDDNNYIKTLSYSLVSNEWKWEVVSNGQATAKVAPGQMQLLSSVLGKSLSEYNDAFKWLENGKEQIGSVNGSKIEQESAFWVYFWRLAPIIAMAAVTFFIFSMFAKGASGGAIAEKNPAQRIKTDKKFSDIAGNDEAKEEIKEIVDYLKDPKKYAQSGARLPHGILLGGPPGTGKTLLAKATAGEANVPFYFISASSFVEMYVGLGAKRVRQVIAEARKNAPAIVFIDELDAIGRTRGSGIGGGHDEREQTLNQLLVEMDGIQGNTGILFFAATNRTDVLDPALVRPGRFDRTITVGLPNKKEREEILTLHAKGKAFDKRVDMANIAKRTPGYSGAELENVINEATLLSVRENTNVITLEQMDEAIDRVMSGPAKKNRSISEKELTNVAYHEAGHAVVGIKIPGGNKVQKITIIPRGQAGGYNLMIPEEEKYNMTKQELLASITSFMGGRAAEAIVNGEDNISTGASNDIEKATAIARRMVTQYGMSSLGPVRYEEDEGSPFLGKALASNKSYSSRVGHEIDIEVRSIINDALKLATKTIIENRELLELIKTRLLEKETIVGEEIEYIAQNMKLPDDSENTFVNKKFTLDELLESEETVENEAKNELKEEQVSAE